MQRQRQKTKDDIQETLYARTLRFLQGCRKWLTIGEREVTCSRDFNTSLRNE